MGPLKQLKAMFEPKRLIATVVMLVNILSLLPFAKKFSFSLKAKLEALLKGGYFSFQLFFVLRVIKPISSVYHKDYLTPFYELVVLFLINFFKLMIWSKIFFTKYFLLNATIRLIDLFSKTIPSRTSLERDFQLLQSNLTVVCWLQFFL